MYLHGSSFLYTTHQSSQFFRRKCFHAVEKAEIHLKSAKPIDLMGKWEYNTANTYEVSGLVENARRNVK